MSKSLQIPGLGPTLPVSGLQYVLLSSYMKHSFTWLKFTVMPFLSIRDGTTKPGVWKDTLTASLVGSVSFVGLT